MISLYQLMNIFLFSLKQARFNGFSDYEGFEHPCSRSPPSNFYRAQCTTQCSGRRCVGGGASLPGHRSSTHGRGPSVRDRLVSEDRDEFSLPYLSTLPVYLTCLPGQAIPDDIFNCTMFFFSSFTQQHNTSALLLAAYFSALWEDGHLFLEYSLLPAHRASTHGRMSCQ